EQRERKLRNEVDERKERIKQLKRALELEERRVAESPPEQLQAARSRARELEQELSRLHDEASRQSSELEARRADHVARLEKRVVDLEAELNWRLHEGRAREAAATEAFR